jgi:hypothetical protein
MTPHQTARWNNVVAIANRINALLDEGYLVFDEHQQPVRRFTITDTRVETVDEAGDSIVYASTEEGWDNVLYIPMAEYSASFAGWVAVHPRDFVLVLSIGKVA